MASTNGKSAVHMSSSKAQWSDQFKSKNVIYQEISEHVKKRRKQYDDLNDLLEKRERVISLSRDTPDRKTDVVEHTDSIKAVPAFTRKVFIDKNELEEAIEIALATGCKVHGSQEGVTKKDILEFVQKLFYLAQKRVDEAEEKTAQQQSKLQLVCKVIRATDLKPKVGNGSSDRNPYCRVGIMHQKHYHPGAEFKYMSEWQKTGNVTEVASTDFKTATLEPVWNEDVELDVKNVEEEVVVVEVWDNPLLDCSPKKRRSWNIKGHRTPMANKEDFLGWMFHPLLLVPIAGAELKVTLMSRGKKPRNGFITLFLSIQADAEEKSLEACMGEHHLLTRAVIENFSKEEDGERKLDWNGELSSEAERLLEYHGVLNGLNKLQIASVRLSELLKYHKYDSVEMEAFSKVIKRMKELQFLFPDLESFGTSHEPASAPASQSPSASSPPVSRSPLTLSPPTSSIHSTSPRTSPRSSPSPDLPEPKNTQWVSKLFSEVEKLEKELMDTMKDHIRLVYFGFEGKAEKLDPYLSALLEVYTFKPYIDQMDPKKDIQRELEQCIEPSVDSWFNRLKLTVMPNNGTEPRELRDLCVYCLRWSEKVVDQLILHPTFIQAGVDYFALYILSLDEQLSEEVQNALKNYRIQKPDTITFEIYATLQELIVLLENVDEDVRKGLTILGFHKWFQEFVPGWIDVATEKCEGRIRQAIELDEIVKITEDLKLSSSAVDTNGFLLQMATFWQHLNWPIASEAYGYAVSLVENMCSCASLFIGEVFGSLQSEDLVDDQGRFKVSEKLCLVLNNVFHVREHMAQMQEHMELDKLYEQLREEYMRQYELAEEGGPVVSEMHSDPVTGLHIKAKNLLDKLLISADEDVIKKIEDLIGMICEKICPDIQKLINGVVSSDATETEDTVMAPLLDYLTQNLITLGSNLLPELFESIIARLWEISIEALDKVLNTLSSQKKQFSVNQRLSNTLKSLREFYYCDGGGVSRKILDSEKYTSVKSKLDILGMPTDQLIVQFYADLVETQHSEVTGEKMFGELVLSVGYTSMLEVTVIQGNTETIHEPYVKLRLSSICNASDKHWKTKPVKGVQKSPLFNEDIKLPVTEEEMNSEGAVVLFYLLDKKSKSRSPYGMCAISCSEVPHLPAPTKSTLMDPNAPQRKNFRLPLFRLTSETAVLSELIARTEFKDKTALNFLIINDLLLSNGSHLNAQLQKKRAHSMIKKPK